LTCSCLSHDPDRMIAISFNGSIISFRLMSFRLSSIMRLLSVNVESFPVFIVRTSSITKSC
jgi:hypothetical protein